MVRGERVRCAPFLCTTVSCWRMAVCCAATRQQKFLSCCTTEAVSALGGTWDLCHWWRRCISLVAWGGGWWHWRKEVPVQDKQKSRTFPCVYTAFSEPHHCLGCQAMCKLEVQTQEGTWQQAVLRQLVCRQKDEREPLNLLSSVLLLQAILAWLAYFNQSMEREDRFSPPVLWEMPDVNKECLLSACVRISHFTCALKYLRLLSSFTAWK